MGLDVKCYPLTSTEFGAALQKAVVNNKQVLTKCESKEYCDKYVIRLLLGEMMTLSGGTNPVQYVSKKIMDYFFK